MGALAYGHAHEIAWTQSIHGGVADDLSFEVVTDDAGNLYIGGWTDVDICDADIRIQHITPNGRPGWSYTYEYTYAGAAGGDDIGFALGWEGTDLVIAGIEAIPEGRRTGRMHVHDYRTRKPRGDEDWPPVIDTLRLRCADSFVSPPRPPVQRSSFLLGMPIRDYPTDPATSRRGSFTGYPRSPPSRAASSRRPRDAHRLAQPHLAPHRS